jgi:hypothetical protein
VEALVPRSSGPVHPPATVASTLWQHEFQQLCNDFAGFRQLYEPVCRQLRQSRQSAIFDFARGLRLSARLIYAVRKKLDGSDLTASWGQLMDGDGYVSPECDVIIHSTSGCSHEWNGDRKNRVMEYRFIQKDSALAVISCKSQVSRASSVDRQYASRLREHINRLWLFAECCPPSQVTPIRAAAIAAGYDSFWHMYEYKQRSLEFTANAPGWSAFMSEVGSLPTARTSRTSHPRRQTDARR